MEDRGRVEVRQVTEEAWTDLEQLLGPAGASNGCWCQYWLLGPDYHRRARSENRRDLARQAHAGHAGLLAYRAGAAVGWARFTRRSDLGWLTTRFASFDFGAGDPWTLSCFFVPPRARGAGVMTALVDFAARWSRGHGDLVEGYPIDPTVPGATRNRFPGILQTFLGAGFVERGRLTKDRVRVVAGETESGVG